MRDELRNWSDRDADAVPVAEGSIRRTVMRGAFGIAGVASPGHAYEGFPMNPGELPASPLSGHLVAPIPKTPGLRRERAAPERSEQPSNGVSCCQGKPEAQAWAGEQSYESIVPMKVENRRAPARGGHDIHWREGMSRSTYRRSAACTGP